MEYLKMESLFGKGTKPTVKFAFITVISTILFAVFYLSIDYLKHRPRTIHCDDGQRETVDYRDLQLKYSSYNISLNVEVMNKLKVRPEIGSKLLQTAYESTQGWDQFLKGLVAGFNSCAISKADYNLALQRYKAMEDISKNLSQRLQKNTLSKQDVEIIRLLIEQYSFISKELFSQQIAK
jgi:hypothetical protein